MVAVLLHVVFVLAVLGTKLMIGLWAIYYLFPGGKSCPECDAETIPIQMGIPQRIVGYLLFLGRVRRRWCPECAWDGFARPSAGSAAPARPQLAPDPAIVPSNRDRGTRDSN